MNHKSRKNAYQRSTPNKKSVKQYILFVEGRNTEKSYFDLLKRANCKVMPVTRRGHGISQCIEFVDEAVMTWKSMTDVERDKYEQRWLVFDYDGRTDFADAINPVTKRHRIVDAYERAKTMHENKKKIGAEFNESVTTIYELLTALGVIVETKTEAKLYCK